MSPGNNTDYYESPRKYPRVELDVPGVVLCKDQLLINMKVYDISPDGLQVRCTRKEAQLLNPDGKKISPLDNIMVSAMFSLPIDHHYKKIQVICNVYYFTLLQDTESDEDVVFGLKFKKFNADCGKYVERYIEQQLEPAY